MFFEGDAIFDGDWLWDCALSEDAPAFGKRGISSDEGKPSAALVGGRRLLTRGMSASAKSKNARGMASQFDISTTDPDVAGSIFPILRCYGAAE